jgi:exopolysaccharide biosynthesis protein
VEWQDEGLRKKRFVNGNYPRTALGISKDQKTLILFSVEGNRRGTKKRGIDLENLAKLMLAEGAYQAINFDGGSSATLVVDNEIMNPTNLARKTRKISSALLIIDTTPNPDK